VAAGYTRPHRGITLSVPLVSVADFVALSAVPLGQCQGRWTARTALALHLGTLRGLPRDLAGAGKLLPWRRPAARDQL